MLALYLGTMAFGAVLIGLTVVMGSHDMDTDTDMDSDGVFDIEQSVGLEASVAQLGDASDATNLWLPFTSMRFYTFFTFAFGLGGTLMSLFTTIPQAFTFGLSSLTALCLGWAAAWGFKKLYTDTVSGDTGIQRYVGQEARVLLPVHKNKRGKIVLQSAMGRIELSAETLDEKTFGPQDIVLIAHIDGSIANITSIHSGANEDNP